MDFEEWEEMGFDPESIDDAVEELIAGQEGRERGYPAFRATIRGGRIWLRAWSPALLQAPQARNLATRPVAVDTAVADLTVAEVETESGRRDLIARFLYRSAEADDEGPLIDWASRTGYSMLWLPDRLVELEIDPNRLGEARTECPTCGARWAQDDPAFWAEVLRQGYFPDTCNYCGCALPEWTS
jgi:hypothetical protein